jgi:4'-phosphopantetheinyl transferase
MSTNRFHREAHAMRPLDSPLPAGIEIFRLDLDTQSDAVPARHTLTAGECARADRFARTADRVRFTAARAALRVLLAERMGCAPMAVPIATGAHGKPFVDLPGAMVPPFNVSHSGAHALIALGDPHRVRHLGVDIEQCRAEIDVEAVLSMAFTAREAREVREATDPLRALHMRWAAKEALLKAVGVGMAEHLQSVGIHPGESGRFSVECALPAWTCFEAMALDAPLGYAAALAWCPKQPA